MVQCNVRSTTGMPEESGGTFSSVPHGSPHQCASSKTTLDIPSHDVWGENVNNVDRPLTRHSVGKVGTWQNAGWEWCHRRSQVAKFTVSVQT